jgi:type I restriction-modification system DNA methylase subunit
MQEAPPNAAALTQALGAAHVTLLNNSSAVHADVGEYRTPPPITRLPACLVLPLRSGVVIVDPTCDDGALLIAAAQEVRATRTTPLLAGVVLRPRSAWLLEDHVASRLVTR